MNDQRRSAIAVGAIIAAIVAFFVSPVPGFFLGLLAIVLGLVGVLRAASPRVRGAVLSIVAILLGAVAVVLKITEGVFDLLF